MSTPDWGGRKVARLRAAVVARYGDRCHLCGQRIPDALRTASPDHLLPRSRGGTDAITNLRPAHRSCNAARQDTPLDVWFRAHPLPTAAPLAPSRTW